MQISRSILKGHKGQTSDNGVTGSLIRSHAKCKYQAQYWRPSYIVFLSLQLLPWPLLYHTSTDQRWIAISWRFLQMVSYFIKCLPIVIQSWILIFSLIHGLSVLLVLIERKVAIQVLHGVELLIEDNIELFNQVALVMLTALTNKSALNTGRNWRPHKVREVFFFLHLQKWPTNSAPPRVFMPKPKCLW